MRKAIPATMFSGKDPARLSVLQGWVLENGVTEMMQMHADLVGATAVQFAFDQANLVGRFHDAIFRLGFAPVR